MANQKIRDRTLKKLGVKNCIMTGRPLNPNSAYMVFGISPEAFEEYKNHPVVEYIKQCWEEKKRED